jgi:hypothetical protein
MQRLSAKQTTNQEERNSMLSSRCLLSVVTLTAGLSLGIAAMAADMPKEGTYKGTYSGVGTFKVNALDKDRVLVSIEEIGLNMSDGFLDHMTWHCWGNGDYVKGVGVDQGHCTATDLSGDKLIAKFVSEKHTAEQKSFTVTVTCDGGTGKYAGASCTETDTMRGGEFPPAPEGSYVQYVTFQGTYKLP